MRKTLFFSAVAALISLSTATAQQQTFTRTVLIEQFTTVNCGWCPSGAERITQAVENMQDVIWIKHHAGFGTDFLTNNIHTTMTVFYGGSTFAPAMMVDRTRFYEEEDGPVTSIPSTYLGVKSFVNQARNVDTYCKIDSPIQVTYNAGNRKIHGQITGRFGEADRWNENTRLTIFVIEDSIVGDQHDYTEHGNWTDYVHMGTVRAAITNKWGDPIEVNESDRTFRYNIDYSLPNAYNYEHCKLVAFVYNYDESNINNCAVLNAAKSEFLSSLLDIKSSEPRIAARLYPNPAKGDVIVEADEEIVSVTVTNSLGQTVADATPAETRALLHTAGLPTGLYIVRIQTPSGSTTKKLMLY